MNYIKEKKRRKTKTWVESAIKVAVGDMEDNTRERRIRRIGKGVVGFVQAVV